MAATWVWIWVQTSALPSIGRIYGGDVVPTCGFPSAVMLLSSGGGGCSGSLVHPEIVLYAAHCGADIATVYFGEQVGYLPQYGSFSERSPARKVALSAGACHLYPGHDGGDGTDFAYCRLPQPQRDVPIVPILMGCEAAILGAPQTVTLVGYGYDEDNVAGTKRQTLTTAMQVESNKVRVGSTTHASRGGDSGGPAYVQLAAGNGAFAAGDDTWRLFGVDAYGFSEDLPTESLYGLAAQAVPWIEADTGLDLTPCGDALGAWAPGPACGPFPTRLQGGGGDWASGCQFPALAPAPSSTCGPAAGAAAPQLELVAPQAGDSLMAGGLAPLVCRVAFARADAANQVIATFDGAPVSAATGAAAPPAASAPYTFGPVTWQPGQHLVGCQATDAAGRTTTLSVVLQAATATANSPAGPAPSGGVTVAGGAGSAPDYPAGIAPQSAGAQLISAAGCRAAAGPTAAGPLAALGALAWRRRRRPRRSPPPLPAAGAGSPTVSASKAPPPGRRTPVRVSLAAVVATLAGALMGCGITLGVGGSGTEAPGAETAGGTPIGAAAAPRAADGAATSSTPASGSGGGTADGLTVQIISSQSQTANDVAVGGGGVVPAGPLPSAQSNLTGTVMGQALPAADVLFEFAFDGVVQNSLAMYLFFADQPSTCRRHTDAPDQAIAAGGRSLRLELFNFNTNEDQPFAGSYQIYSPLAGPPSAAGNWAAATFVLADGACGNQLAPQNAWATAGQVTIVTHVTAAGVYLTGQLTGVAFGSQRDVVGGGFTAQSCLNSKWAAIDVQRTCR